MPYEIERKFLVDPSAVPTGASPELCLQGYLATGPPTAIRARIMGGKAILNIKAATTDIRRLEFEYEVPLDHAHELLKSCCAGSIIEKTRHCVQYDGKTWEIDVFAGANAGLIVAEIELESEDEFFARPSWLGREVSGDVRYFNSSLCQRPYSTWPEDER